MNKEKWIEDVLQSAKSISPIPSNPFLATRIEARLQQERPAIPLIPLRWVYSSVVTMTVLLVLNIFIWSSPAPRPRQNGIQQVIQEYGWNNQDIYSMNFSK